MGHHLGMSETHIPKWTIADRLRKARISAGFSQDELAALARISRRTITSGERGSHVPTWHHIRAWAEATHVPLDWILDGDDSPVGSSTLVTAEYSSAA